MSDDNPIAQILVLAQTITDKHIKEFTAELEDAGLSVEAVEQDSKMHPVDDDTDQRREGRAMKTVMAMYLHRVMHEIRNTALVMDGKIAICGISQYGRLAFTNLSTAAAIAENYSDAGINDLLHKKLAWESTIEMLDAQMTEFDKEFPTIAMMMKVVVMLKTFSPKEFESDVRLFLQRNSDTVTRSGKRVELNVDLIMDQVLASIVCMSLLADYMHGDMAMVGVLGNIPVYAPIKFAESFRTMTMNEIMHKHRDDVCINSVLLKARTVEALHRLNRDDASKTAGE